MLGKGLTVGIIVLFIASAVIPMTVGYNVKTKNVEPMAERLKFDKHIYPENCNFYNVSEKPHHVLTDDVNEKPLYNDVDSTTVNNQLNQPQSLDGPINSSWPMYCHDVRHTGRSPYSTADNLGGEKWRFDTNGECSGSPVIDQSGTIYIGSSHLYAVYPNGTLKWTYSESIMDMSAPAIDENGVLYVGEIWGSPNYLYAIYTNNGSLKWKLQIGTMWSSPAIGDDGMIYCSTDGGEVGAIHAINPNGTEKWRYITNDVVMASPAIGLDGTIYCGSIDDYVYALYPNNGTLKWKFYTGTWVHSSATIADDGTIYVGSDNGLYALCPNNGTMKWFVSIGSVWGSPALDKNGTIYVGVFQHMFYAIYPNGTIKWSFGNCDEVWWTSASISADGMIFFGSNIDSLHLRGGELIALNPDGTEHWRILIATDWIWSTPAIGTNETVYIGSFNDGYHPGWSWGYLHAIGPIDPNSPSAPEIEGKTNVIRGIRYYYTFKSISPLGRNIYYYIDWGDKSVNNWIGPYDSGKTIVISHVWVNYDTSKLRSRAKDTYDLVGLWGTLSVTLPIDPQLIKSSSQQISQQHSNQLLLKMMQRVLLNIRCNTQ